jgi:phospholipase/carboxylesterase
LAVPTLNLIHQVRSPSETQGLAPAIVMVHGWLGNEKVMWAFERALPPEALVVSVRAPFAAEGGYGWIVPGEEGSFEKGLAALQEFVQQLPHSFPIDPSKITAMGFSQGAAMAYALLLSGPELITGTAALAGFMPNQALTWAKPNGLSGKRVFIAHGTEDPTVPLKDAERAREVIDSCGAEVTYCTDPVGHKLGTQGMRQLKVWLAEQNGKRGDGV